MPTEIELNYILQEYKSQSDFEKYNVAMQRCGLVEAVAGPSEKGKIVNAIFAYNSINP